MDLGVGVVVGSDGYQSNLKGVSRGFRGWGGMLGRVGVKKLSKNKIRGVVKKKGVFKGFY